MKLDQRERITQEIMQLENFIKWKKEDLKEEVENFKDYTKDSNDYQIITFLPSKIKQIEDTYKRIQELEERKRMLVYIIQE